MHQIISIIGKTNVGKSALINNIAQNKLTITSSKPKTTNSILIENGILNNSKIVFIDIPGPDFKITSRVNLNINYKFLASFIYSDILLFVIESIKWTNDDYIMLEFIHLFFKSKNKQVNIFLILNKIDCLLKKKEMLPVISKLSELMNFENIIPLSAKYNLQTNILIKHILCRKSYFKQNLCLNYCSNNIKFKLTEIIREKMMRVLDKELPYCFQTSIEYIFFKNSIIFIYGLIFSNKKTHKNILIGKGGNKVKNIGIKSRKDMQFIFGKRVCLKLWIK